MSKVNNTTENTEIQSTKFKHLTIEERREIQEHIEDKKSYGFIAKTMGRSKSTIHDEVKRGSCSQRLTTGKVITKYFADLGQRVYEENRKNSKSSGFEKYSEKFLIELDSALLKGKRGCSELRTQSVASFQSTYVAETGERIPSVKTCYRIIDAGFIRTRNIDLPVKPKRSAKGAVNAKPRGKNVKRLGKSISERPVHVLEREEFGHWEGDLVMGKKDKGEPAILTLLERKTRQSFIMRVPNSEASSCFKVAKDFLVEFGISAFKSITFDNGSEFSEMSKLEELATAEEELNIYFAHAYSSWERGSNEHFNGLLREFVPKGISINEYSDEYLLACEEAINNRPRKILEYRTSEQMFEHEMAA